MSVFRAGNGAFLLVDLQAQTPFDEPTNAFHHSCSCAFAMDIDVAVISVPHELVSPTVKFPIQFVEVDKEVHRGGYDPLAWISDCLNSFGLFRFFH